MKKFEKGKRFLTFLLVALMVVQQSSVTTLAEELAEYTQEAQNQDTEAVAEVSEASEPEASVPDSDKAQEQQPAAEEPAAPAEQETAEVTEAPQATEAPAQEAAPTEAPAQEAEQTEAPQENAAVTETPQATEAPAVTEAPAETATKAQFSGAVDNATANVTLSQPISDKAVFVAKQYSVDSDYFVNNAEAAVSQWVINNGLTVLDATAYDMHFEEDGQEIAVNQSANVSLSFNSPILTMTGDAGVPSNIYVLHIVNGQAVAAGSASQDGNGAVVAANVVTEGFSPFVFVKAVSGDAVEPAESSADLSNFVTSVTLNGAEWNDNTTILPDTDYEIELTFKENPEGMQFNTAGELEYTLPDALLNSWLASAQEFDLNIDGHTVTGNKARLSKDGRTLIVKLNNNDPNLTGSGDVHFWIKIGAKFDANKNGQEIKFGASTNKTLHIDNSSSVSINKTHSDYDSNKNELTYTVEVTSKGANQKVQVTDALSGEILKFKEIKSITSNKRDNLSQDVTPSGNGFQYAVGDMVHDEVVTITYTAEVDYSKIPANGTVSVDNKKNTASVIVDGEKKEEKTDTYDKDINNKISISKSMTGATENGVVTDPSNIPWKLVVNESKRASMSGKNITDTIDSNSQAYMHYTGSGITIQVSTGEVRTIPWSNLNLAKDSNGNIISWSYTAPESDGNVSYEISYATAADNSSFYDKTDLKNNASVDGGGSGSATAPVGPNEGNKGAAIAKQGKLSADHKKITWTITVTVPVNGIPNATLVDSLPCSDPYLDAYDGEGITVKYLDADETHTDTLSQDGKTITIAFSYRDTDGTIKKGLKGTGEKRTLEITYSTNVDSEWAQTDEAWRYGHTNTAKLTGPNITASDTVHVTKTSLSKSGQCNGTVKIGNIDYPKFDFTLTFKGDVKDGDVITDTFPTEYFKVYENPQIAGSNNQWYQGETKGGNVSAISTGFKIDSYPKDADNEYYKYYQLKYTLIPKDENALKELQKLALVAPNHTYKLHNEASWGGADSQVDVDYTCKPLTKSDAFEYSTNKVHFTIKANEAGLKLNGGESLTLTDTMSTTLRYDASSLVVKAGGEDITQKVIPNENNGTLTITGIPDEKVIEITYDARVLGSGQVTYSNRAELTGCGDGINISKTVTLNGSAGGGGSRLGIKIRKYKAGDQSSKLAGAVFQLYKRDDNGNGVPVTDKNDNIVTCTTNDDGNAELQTDMDKNGWAFVKDRTYYLVEITAPEGYQLDSTPIEFKFVDSPSASNEYYSGDTIYVANEEKNEGHLVITKTITGNRVTDEVKASLSFTVKNNATNNKETYTLNDFTQDANGVWKLELDKTAGGYTVTETASDVNGVKLSSVSYTIDDRTSESGSEANVTVNKNQTTTVAFTNVYSREIQISKQDILGNELAGAKLEITGKADGSTDGIDPIQWISGEEKTVSLKPGSYILTEKEVPAGYVKAAPISFTVDAAGNVKVGETKVDKLTMVDKYKENGVQISKTDVLGNELGGATLEITGKENGSDKDIDPIRWTSGEEKTVNLKPGSYTLTETEVPDGYVKAAPISFTVDISGNVKVGKEKVDQITMVDNYTVHDIQISKQDILGNELAGAKLEITGKADGSTDGIDPIQWISGEEKTVSLKPGSYILTEKEVPAGYVKAAPISFTVDAAGNVKVGESEVDKLTMVDEYDVHEIEINKTDITGNELEGAELEITGKETGSEEDIEPISLISGATSQKVSLKPGSYTLTETNAPKGYDIADPINFTVDKDGNVKVGEDEVEKIIMVDELTERDIEISKVDLTNNTELEGASLQITGTDIDGKEIIPIKWTSGDDGKNENGTVKTHTVKLTAGTYTLSETAAPDGYKIAESIKFTIDKEGSVTSETKDAVTGNKVTMKDEKKDTSASISVTKNLKTVAGENIYAVDQTFYVALYEDENCTKLASEIKALTFKNSTSETVTFEGVEPNKTYYVGECTKDGVRYLSGVVAGTKYVAQFTDGNSVTVETPNGSKAVYFDNRFMKFPDGFYKEGVLSITKLFKDKIGKAKNSDETFYAGIFDDEECTKLSENVAQNIIPLNLNGSSSVTAQIKVSIAQGTSKTFYVTEVDKDGKPINEETFKYDVSVENGEVTFDENNTSAEVTITNQEQDEDKDKDKDKDKGKTTTTSSNATSTKAVKTGDNTPIGIFVILLIAAIVVIGGGIYLKRRKK